MGRRYWLHYRIRPSADTHNPENCRTNRRGIPGLCSKLAVPITFRRFNVDSLLGQPWPEPFCEKKCNRPGESQLPWSKFRALKRRAHSPL